MFGNTTARQYRVRIAIRLIMALAVCAFFGWYENWTWFQFFVATDLIMAASAIQDIAERLVSKEPA